MRSKYKLLSLAVLLIAVTQTITPAIALPGQSVKSLIRWAKSRPVLTIRTSNQHLYLPPQTEKLKKSNKDTTVKFSKYNEKALKLILKIYSSHSSNHSKKQK
jgi:hypothetical protein